MTAKQAAAILAEHADGAFLRTGRGLLVPVLVEDVRQVWDRVDLLVSPVNGHGEVWVSAECVETGHPVR